jgi:hypothetical protein
MIALHQKFPNPETKLKADHTMPLRHNFTLQLMLALHSAVNAKFGFFAAT